MPPSSGPTRKRVILAISGIVAAPLLVLIMAVSNNKNIMGHRANSRLANTTATL